MKPTHYSKAPLPFIGQKRMFLNEFKTLLNEYVKDGEGWTIVDVFGGSGLLSHVAKRICPKARVIYNDYDHYSERIQHIHETNELRRRFESIVAGMNKIERLSDSQRHQVLEVLNQYQGYKDMRTIASWFLHSGRKTAGANQLLSAGLYNNLKKADYPTADDYLEGIEVVSESFEVLIPKHRAKNTLLILDPPYLYTNQEDYKMDKSFDLIDFLKLMLLVKPPFIFFSSTRSELIRYLEFMQVSKLSNYESFIDCQRIVKTACIGKSNTYEDNVVYKF